MKTVIVAGAGIGGLVSAGLSARRGHKVVLFERSTIPGGRSHVVNVDGFSMSYGAHGLIAPKVQPMKEIFNELGVQVSGRRPDNGKFYLYHEGKLVPGLFGKGIFTSDALSGINNRIAFILRFMKLLRGKYDPRLTVGEWIEQNVHNEGVATALRAHLALSAYDGGIDAYPVNAFIEHARLIASTTTPLVYVDFAKFMTQLEQSVISNGGEIKYGHRVTQLIIRGGRISGVMVNDEMFEADAVVLNLPPRYLSELSSDSQYQAEIQPTLNQPVTNAFVYDVMLDKRIRGDVKNVLDLQGLVYINDFSLNCPSTAPDGTQMLNCLKLLGAGDDQLESEAAEAEVERVLDDVYPTWRSHIRHRRVIKRAMVRGIAERVGVQKLPIQSRIDQLFYVGDSTVGRGAFSIPAYDSALQAADSINREP